MELRLRPYREDDDLALVEAANESVKEVSPWMPWCRPDFSRVEARDWLRKKVAAWQARSEFEFCIVDSADRFLGACGINQINMAHRLGNVGYWVRTTCTSRGVATAAVKQLIEFAAKETDLIRLEIVVATGNTASARVAEKVGAKLDARIPSRLFLHGTSHDAFMFSVILNHAQPTVPGTPNPSLQRTTPR